LAQNNISKHQKEELEKILVPSLEEIEAVIKKYLPENANLEMGTSTNIDNVLLIKKDLAAIINARIENTPDIPKQFLKSKETSILNSIVEELQSKKSYFVSEDSIKQITNFAKIPDTTLVVIRTRLSNTAIVAINILLTLRILLTPLLNLIHIYPFLIKYLN
jgi:NADH:ubiquinone oxidoreductase subunit E